MKSEPTDSLLAAFLKQSWSGFVVLGLGAVFCILGIVLLPDLSNPAQREAYESFFLAAGALTAGLFVTLAVSSRDTDPDLLLGSMTVIFVGAAALAAVISLLPNACSAMYSVAFVVLVTGGLAGLISTALIATVALLQIRAEHEAEVLAKVLDLGAAEVQDGGGVEAEKNQKSPR